MLGWLDSRQLDTIIPSKPAKNIASALGDGTVTTLLTHYPRAYSHHGSGVGAEHASDGDIVTFIGTVTGCSTGRTHSGKSVCTVYITTGGVRISAVFFNARYPAKQLTAGVSAMFSGKKKTYGSGVQISHPSYVVLPEPGERTLASGQLKNLAAFGEPEQIEQLLTKLEWLPVYPLKKGTTSWEVLGAVDAVLAATEPIPEPLDRVPDGMVSFDEALRGIHQPDERGPEPFETRIKFNEALALSLVMALRRADVAHRVAPACPENPRARSFDAVEHSLPFTLTDGQRDVIATIGQALSASTPMSMLLQGDVGSGKTLVALAAMLQVCDNKRQSVLLAPTEVLATQHARSIEAMLHAAGSNATVTLLTGSLPTADKKKALCDIVSGESDIIIGTHALLSDGVEFFDLALVIVDEQHRFGVEQRDALRGSTRRGGDVIAHMLVMTATPIPRTVAMTTFGDLKVVTLKEAPAQRAPVTSVVLPESKPAWVKRAIERIREEVSNGRQAFVVCSRIDGPGGVNEVADKLKRGAFADLKVAALHGKLPADDKETIMAAFAAGDIDVLVSTTVIEVGIDVPNATVMLIRDAENFGVSQIHQLRGRVGRGHHPGLCLIHTTHDPESPSYERLEAVAATSDGFKLAEVDLRTRQEGDVLGEEQSGGHRRVKLLDLIDDADLIDVAATEAQQLVERDKKLAQQLVADIGDDPREFIGKN